MKSVFELNLKRKGEQRLEVKHKNGIILKWEWYDWNRVYCRTVSSLDLFFFVDEGCPPNYWFIARGIKEVRIDGEVVARG